MAAFIVTSPGIEPGTWAPEAHVLSVVPRGLPVWDCKYSVLLALPCKITA